MGSAYDPEGSEVVTQSSLYLSRSIDDRGNACKVAKPGNPEVAISNIPIHLAEDVPVERIGNIQFEQNRLRLPNGGSLDDGKVLIQIAWTSPGGENLRKVSVNVSSAGSQGSCTGIE